MKNKAGNIVALFACLLMLVSCFPESVSADQTKKTAPVQLHRADFRVEGASCVACLRRIASELRETKGVIKADVSIYRPYWSIVIYDRRQTSFDQIKDAIKQEKVHFADLEDKPISEVPVVIIPRGLSEQIKEKGGK